MCGTITPQNQYSIVCSPCCFISWNYSPNLSRGQVFICQGVQCFTHNIISCSHYLWWFIFLLRYCFQRWWRNSWKWCRWTDGVIRILVILEAKSLSGPILWLTCWRIRSSLSGRSLSCSAWWSSTNSCAKLSTSLLLPSVRELGVAFNLLRFMALSICAYCPVAPAICLIMSSFCRSTISLLYCSSSSVRPIRSNWVSSGEYLVEVADRSGYLLG